MKTRAPNTDCSPMSPGMLVSVPRSGNRPVAERERVADPGIDGREEGRVDDRATLLQLRPDAGGGGRHRAIEWPAGIDGVQLDKPRAATVGRVGHRAEVGTTGDAHRAAACLGERIEQRAGRGDDVGDWPTAESVRSAPRSACACSATETVMLSVNELTATSAPTPAITEAVSSARRRRAARASRQAQAGRQTLRCHAPRPRRSCRRQGG